MVSMLRVTALAAVALLADASQAAAQPFVLSCAQLPAFTGDVTSTAGLCALTLTAPITGAQGGTGVANTGKTITLGGNLLLSGAFGTTFTVTGTTALTLPTSGTVTALGNTVTGSGGTIVESVSPALTGSPTAPTQSASDNSTKLATTAYTDAASGSGKGAEQTISFQPGLITAVVNTKGVFGKFVKASTVDNIEASALLFTCAGNPTITLYECGTDASCGTPTTIGSATVTASGQAFDGTISNAAIAAAHYVAWAISAGTCTSLDISATAQIHAN